MDAWSMETFGHLVFQRIALNEHGLETKYSCSFKHLDKNHGANISPFCLK